MSSHRLLLRPSAYGLRALSTEDFVWLPRGELSSIETTVGPRLAELGPVPELHIDLARLAVLVFLADRSSLREQGPGVRWDREFDLSLSVSDPTLWSAYGERLGDLLHVLSGDRWTLRFASQREIRTKTTAVVKPADVVCLFSGGADSLAGALEAQAQTGRAPVLLSHWDANSTSAVQSALVERLSVLWGEDPDHHQIDLRRRSHQLVSGEAFPDEKSRRTRSFLFLALGLAAAAARGSELWMSENGFTTINPPLSPERRGSLTTRTTHPGFLDELCAVCVEMGLKADLRNPLAEQTKGEVLAQASTRLSHGEADTLFSMSHSCGKTPWFKGFRQDTHCGLCFGCLIRRGSFVASGLADSTTYIEDALRGDQRRDDFVTPTRRSTVEAVRYRLDRGYSAEDLLALSLPPRVPLSAAHELVTRGIKELRPVVDDIP